MVVAIQGSARNPTSICGCNYEPASAEKRETHTEQTPLDDYSACGIPISVIDHLIREIVVCWRQTALKSRSLGKRRRLRLGSVIKREAGLPLAAAAIDPRRISNGGGSSAQNSQRRPDSTCSCDWRASIPSAVREGLSLSMKRPSTISNRPGASWFRHAAVTDHPVSGVEL